MTPRILPLFLLLASCYETSTIRIDGSGVSATDYPQYGIVYWEAANYWVAEHPDNPFTVPGGWALKLGGLAPGGDVWSTTTVTSTTTSKVTDTGGPERYGYLWACWPPADDLGTDPTTWCDHGLYAGHACAFDGHDVWFVVSQLGVRAEGGGILEVDCYDDALGGAFMTTPGHDEADHE